MKTPGTSQADPVRGNPSISSQVSSEKKSAVKTWLYHLQMGKVHKKSMERHVMISDSKNLTIDLYSFWRSTDSNQRASFTHFGNPGVWDHTRGPLKHLSSRREEEPDFCPGPWSHCHFEFLRLLIIQVRNLVFLQIKTFINMAGVSPGSFSTAFSIYQYKI